MPPDESLVGRVRAALGSGVQVEEKRMFGGLAFMVDGKMCVTVGKDGIMCRIDPTIYDTVVEREGCRPTVMREREYRGYVRVDADTVKADSDLAYWVRLSLDFNKEAKPARKRGS
jgi:TfoX/Sxy family transcriptional regulator of competence genes